MTINHDAWKPQDPDGAIEDARFLLDYENQRWERIDSKINTFLSIQALLFTVMSILTSFNSSLLKEKNISWFAILDFILLFVGIFTSLVLLRPQWQRTIPNLGQFYEKLNSGENVKLARFFAYWDAMEENSLKNNKKYSILRILSVLLFGNTIISLIILFLLSGI